MRKKQFGYGPSGSGISFADGFTKNPPSMDSDFMWKYKQELLVPPVRLPDEDISLEDFEEMLTDLSGEAFDSMTMMSSGMDISEEEFENLLRDPETAGRRIQIRRNKERMMKNQQHFAILEINAWNNDQIAILDLLDRERFIQAEINWTTKGKAMEQKMLEAYPRIKKEHGKDTADAFVKYGYKLIDSWQPLKPHDYIRYIRRLARRLVLWDDQSNMTIMWLNKVAPMLESGEVPTPFTRIIIAQIYDMVKENDFERFVNFSEQFRIAFDIKGTE